MIFVALLGPLEVRCDDQQLVVPSGKTTELLMRLALAAGTMVRTERLIDELWADDALGVAKNTLQSKVSQLRRALGDAAFVVGGTGGYTLAVDPVCVDVLEVMRLADETSSFRRAGDAAAALESSAAALAKFRGETMFDGSDAEWLAPHRAVLEGLRLRLIEDHLGSRMDLGAGREVVHELETLVAAHPLREGLSALLMTALYRDGRQADALAAYTWVRARLAEELGLDPSPELRKLEQLVLQQDPLLDPPKHTRPRTDDYLVEGNLPMLSSSIVGRDRQMVEVAESMTSHRLVTVVGSAGVGKTRLAIEVCRNAHYDDGVWFVRLDSARTAASVREAVAEALHAGAASDRALTERLRGTNTLIVLDNCEHVIDAVADLVEPLLRAGPGVRLLATSQLPIGIAGEAVYGLQPLTFEDSVALFAQRAGEHGHSFVLDSASIPATQDVCLSLEGLPLAIELAAARTKSLTIDEIARRLEDRFTLLRDPTSRRPERQRALQAAIAWSYELLFPDDQRGLWALACFVDGAPLSAVEHVMRALEIPAEVCVDIVDRLVDRSLVSCAVAADGAVRYWLLDSVRRFAFDRLDESESAQVALSAHAAWFAARAALAADEVRSVEQERPLAFAKIERANIDSALSWATVHDPLVSLAIATNLGWVWVVLGDGFGASRVRASLTASAATASPLQRFGGLLAVGWLDASAGNVEDGHRAIAEATSLLEPGKDSFLHAKAQWYLAYVLAQQGRFVESSRVVEASRAVFRELGSEWEEAASWVLTAHSAIAAGDPASAGAACWEAATLLARVGDPWLMVHAEAMLGGVAQGEHRFADACEHLGRAAAQSHQSGFAATEAYHLANLGRAQQLNGDLDSAARTLSRAIETARSTGDPRVVALSQVRLGRVLRAQGDAAAARTTISTAQDWYRASGGGDGARLADCVLASLNTGSDRDGIRSVESVLANARAADDVEIELLCLDALARMHAELGQTSLAASLLSESDALMGAAWHHVVDEDRIDGREARRLISR
jgi:predicted ATPase/DNA-binding SARP family transcriptional activator